MNYSIRIKLSDDHRGMILMGGSDYDDHEKGMKISEISFLRPSSDSYIIKFKKKYDNASSILMGALCSGDKFDFTIIHCKNNIAIHEITYHKKAIENIRVHNSAIDENQSFEEITILIN
ncbi:MULTISPECIES: hypothetical protein [Providencia]|uniref:hypothetical protein n=1 Tax=Providencia TaxID=586 RepID=UPI0018C47108|nr:MULTISPECIES: hypothetical protein [Providencia]MBG5925967.1 hypothetical protein [Providencia rettgeri]